MSDLLSQLRSVLGEAQVLDAQTAAQRASSYWDPSPLKALALVRPRSTGREPGFPRSPLVREHPI